MAAATELVMVLRADHQAASRRPVADRMVRAAEVHGAPVAVTEVRQAAVARAGLAMAARPAVMEMVVMVPQGMAMAVRRTARVRIRCTPVSPPAMDGIDYRTIQLIPTMGNP
jgi:hypothetical protein